MVARVEMGVIAVQKLGVSRNLSRIVSGNSSQSRDRGAAEDRLRHMITDDPDVGLPEMLREFVNAREELIRKHLKRFLLVE